MSVCPRPARTSSPPGQRPPDRSATSTTSIPTTRR
nr:MAG TPA: hypothetical protein [Caudoviricetes sp.]